MVTRILLVTGCVSNHPASHRGGGDSHEDSVELDSRISIPAEGIRAKVLRWKRAQNVCRTEGCGVAAQ